MSIAPETEGSQARSERGLLTNARRRVEEEGHSIEREIEEKAVDRSARVEDPSGLTRSSLLIRPKDRSTGTVDANVEAGTSSGTPVNKQQNKHKKEGGLWELTTVPKSINDEFK